MKPIKKRINPKERQSATMHERGLIQAPAKIQLTTLEKILNRDRNICGMHAEGCGKIIDKADAEIDHILPKSFIKRLPEAHRKRIQRGSRGPDFWNLQPMHRDCNNKHKKGQLYDMPEFKCSCHGIYMDNHQNRWIMHKSQMGNIKKQIWEHTQYWGKTSAPHVKIRDPKTGETLAEFDMMPVRRQAKGKDITGFKTFGKNPYGHIFNTISDQQRINQNIQELIRTKQWQRAKMESPEMAEYAIMSNQAMECLQKGEWDNAIKICETMFKKYHEQGKEQFEKITGELNQEVKAQFYWISIGAKISKKEGSLEGICRIANSIMSTDGEDIEQEMAREIYEIDIEEYSILTEMVKARAKHLMQKSIKEGILQIKTLKEKTYQSPYRWQMIRPLHGRKI